MTAAGPWLPGPVRPRIDRATVDVWRLPLSDEPPAGRDWAVLSPDERARAERFRFDHHRHRFVAAHARLRDVLGRYLERNPATLVFDAGPRGKPALRDGALSFNLSHAGTEALLAVTAAPAVGCDIEQVDDRVPIDALAARFFSAADRAALEAVPGGERRRAFFRCWTRKEAYIKATGDGLSLALDGFDVTVTGPAALLATRPDPAEASRWTMLDVPAPPGYAGAVCVETRGGTVAARWWTLG